MPIEIKELVIRAVVEAPRDGARRPALDPAADEAARSRLVEACVREVLKALRRSKER
jgi:hypothetical protein